MIPSRTTMDFNNCSIMAGATKAYLQHLQDKGNITMIPAVTMLCVFAITGLVGNSLVLAVYSKKQGINPTKVLIISIASFDLVANVSAIPIAIYTMLDTWDFQIAIVCKVTASLGSFTAMGGAMSLLVVAFIRYRKVCKPYDWQVTIRQAIISSVVACLVAIVVSIPYFIMYGVKTRQTLCPDIRGSECFADDHYFNTIWPLLNNVFFITLYLFLSISLVVMYILVCTAARGHSRRHGMSEYSTQALKSHVKSKAVGNKEKLVCCDVLPANIPATSGTKLESTHRGRIQVQCCCSNQTEEQKSQDDTQSSMILKPYSTASGENVNTNLQTDPDVAKDDSCLSGAIINVAVSRYSQQYPQSAPTVSADQYIPDEKMRLHKNGRSLSNHKQLSNDLILDHARYTKKQQNSSQQSKKICRNDFGSQPVALSTRHTSKPKRATKKQKRSRPLSRVTIMLTIISSIYVLGFLPFLILTIFKNRLPNKYSNLNMIEQSFYQLFYRLYFLNSASNPIIYILCDVSFRRDCINLLKCRFKRGFVINT